MVTLFTTNFHNSVANGVGNMRDVTDIRLDQVIVHILDPKRLGGFVLSERTIPLEGNQRLVDYFVAHIQNSLKDPTAKAACFVAMNDKAVSGICKALLDGHLDLVEGSRRLAQQLYAIITSDKRIKACDLAVCFYQAENQHSVSRYLALLKIDPSEVFRHKTEYDPQGNQYVNFEVETEVMPTTRERLQKCAFVQQLEPRSPDYDMMLLDRQTREKEVAKFFITDFLGAKLALDAQHRTVLFYTGMLSVYNQIHESQPHEAESLHQALHVAITSDCINIDTWLQALSLSEEHKEQIDQVVSQKLPDREFKIDKTYAQKLIRKRRFHGDHDLRVNVSEEEYKQVIRSVERVEEPGSPPYYRIVIHTEKWEEVP
jgi:phosphopantetheine adenylyltransferase